MDAENSASEDISDHSEGRPTFEIGEFLDENYRLFAVLSIFGALSIYVFSLEPAEVGKRIFQFGFVSSQLLFFLTALAIFRRLISFLGGMSNFWKELAFDPSYGSIELSIFLTSFVTLLISMMGVSMSFLTTVSFIFQAVGLLIGFASSFWVLQYVNRNTTLFDRAVSIDSIWDRVLNIGFLGAISFVFLIISAQMIRFVGPTQIFDLQQNEILPPIFATFVFGVFLVGFIYGLACIITTIFFLLGLMKPFGD